MKRHELLAQVDRWINEAIEALFFDCETTAPIAWGRALGLYRAAQSVATLCGEKLPNFVDVERWVIEAVRDRNAQLLEARS